MENKNHQYSDKYIKSCSFTDLIWVYNEYARKLSNVKLISRFDSKKEAIESVLNIQSEYLIELFLESDN